MTDTERPTRIQSMVALIMLALLFAIWPVQHSISLRELLLASSAMLCGYLAWRLRPFSGWRELAWPLVLYSALTAWLFVVAVFISPETVWSLGEIRGQWLKGVLALSIGIWAGQVFVSERRLAVLIVVLFLILLLHLLYVDVMATWVVLEAGRNPGYYAALAAGTSDLIVGDILGILRTFLWGKYMLTHMPDKSSLLSNLAVYFLFVEVYLRIRHNQRILPVNRLVVAFALLATIASLYVVRTRNGIVEIVVAMLLFLAVFILVNRHISSRRLLAGAAGALLLISALSYSSYQADSRWKTLWQTIPIALDTETHRGWLDLNVADSQLPRLADGTPVNRSNYMRIARLKGGAVLAIENPLGVGYGRNAFGHAVKEKYGVSSSHSHSGLLDIAIGAGIPGALLWLAFLASLVALGVRGYRLNRDHYSILLILIAGGFSTRMVLDSVVRDHMLQMFLFLAGLLATVVARQIAAIRVAPA